MNLFIHLQTSEELNPESLEWEPLSERLNAFLANKFPGESQKWRQHNKKQAGESIGVFLEELVTRRESC